MYHLIKKIKKIPWFIRGLFWRFYIISMGGKCGNNLLVQKGFFMKYPPHQGLKFGNNIHFAKDIHIDVPLNGKLSIGSNTSFTGSTYISSLNEVQIGDDVLIAEFVSIRDSFHQFEISSKIRLQQMSTSTIIIGNDCWIGRGTAILKNSHISEGVIIGANSLVNNFISPYSIAFGIPARLKKVRE